VARKKKLIESFAIDTVLDVGASAGFFALEMRRELNFDGRIYSFEPLAKVFKQLEFRSKSDDLWEVFNFAIGDSCEERWINISENTFSSSLLDMLPIHQNAAPESKYKSREKVKVVTLDSVFGKFYSNSNSIYLKIDVQGFEDKVLSGAKSSLDKINTVQLEMSLTNLYRGASSLEGLHQYLVNHGYVLVGLEPGFTDKDTGRLLQVDGIYHRY
jgi:methyltransferase, FkbM family